MQKKQSYLLAAIVLIILFVFVLPELTPRSFDKLILLYARKDDVAADISEAREQLEPVKYIFKLDIYLELFSKIVGAFSLLGILYQFKRDKSINEAEFVLDINNNFITNEKIMAIYKRLEESKNENQQTNPFTQDDIVDLANYLSFFEPFYGLITQKVVDFSSVDQLAYRFFLATNNRFVQEMLLCREGKEIAWKDLYKLHYRWKQYRSHKNHFEVWQKEHDLSNCPKYQSIILDKHA
ncbi:MAG: hypothetical protein P8184_09905 [Calditrichia bacterium]